MQEINEFDQNAQLLLDLIGGDPLAGSGFEAEEPDPSYRSEKED